MNTPQQQDPDYVDLMSWPLRFEQPELPERCPTCDTAFVIEQEAHQRQRYDGEEHVLFWCHLSCPTCAREVSLSNQVDFTSCFHSESRMTADTIAKRQAELRYMALRAYYRHARNGWRWFDKRPHEVFSPQALRAKFTAEFGPVWTPPQA